MCDTKYLNKLRHFAKYLAKSVSMQNNSKRFFCSHRNGVLMLIAISSLFNTTAKIISSSNVFHSSCSLEFFLMLLYTTVVLTLNVPIPDRKKKIIFYFNTTF